ncbi:hypothetical protein [Pseudonocardia dioxanivorans]|nr:hypothetical protein [Pseudonocardia dioxanivorans]
MTSPHKEHSGGDTAGGQLGPDPVQVAAAAASAALSEREAARQALPLDPGVAAWPQLRWEPAGTVDITQMWCFWCDEPMIWHVGEYAWHVVNPGEVFGDLDAPFTYLHAGCVPTLYSRERLTHARRALRQHHTRYQQAVTAAYGANQRREPDDDQHAEIDDRARNIAAAVGELLDLLDAEPRL